MSSVKLKLFKGKTLSNGEHPIVIQIIKDRKRKVISTGKSCLAKFWDEKEGAPKKQHPDRQVLAMYLNKKKSDAFQVITTIETEKGDAFSLMEFDRKYRNKNKKITVFVYTSQLIEKFIKADKIGNSLVYKDTLRELKNFNQSTDFLFTDIDIYFLKKFVQHFQERQIKENTMSVYFRTLRSIYNKAIQDGYAKKSDYPFEQFKVSQFNTSTQKRAISANEIKSIIDFKADEGTCIFHSKNYFVFSFYTMGMNYNDLAKLKWSDINQDRIFYTRAKTGKHIQVKILPPVQAILNYYQSESTNTFVFPILDESIHKSSVSINNRVKKTLKATNKNLKFIGAELGIKIPLTTYVARHSWATAMKNIGTTTSIISQGLGHHSEETTQTYLDSFGNDIVDNANENLLKNMKTK